MDGWNSFTGKKVFIELKNGRRYQGTVLEYENHFLKIIDKFGLRIYISTEELNLIQEEG